MIETPRATSAAMISGRRTTLRRATGAVTIMDMPVIGSMTRPATAAVRPLPSCSHWVTPYISEYMTS